MTVLGTQRLDGRSQVAKAVQRFRADLIRDLGGLGDVSRAQLAIVEQASRAWVMLSSVDDWLARQPSLVDRRRRQLLPVLRERQQLADSLLRHLTALGLERNSTGAERVRAFLTGPASRPTPAALLDGDAGRTRDPGPPRRSP